jgi:predicted  nucleic acid-binding Zn-ribbon protein
MNTLKDQLDRTHRELAPKVDEAAHLEFEIEELERQVAQKKKRLKVLDKEIEGLVKKIDGYELAIQLGLNK